MKQTSLQTKPYSLGGDQGRFQSLGALVSLKASSEQTGGAFNLFEAVCPSGYETPLHIHYAEDVAIWVLEGSLDIFWSDERQRAEAGSFFFQPRGTPHGFRVTGTTHARILYLTTPGGFDEFVIERSPSFGNTATPESHFKIEILGSLPD